MPGTSSRRAHDGDSSHRDVLGWQAAVAPLDRHRNAAALATILSGRHRHYRR